MQTPEMLLSKYYRFVSLHCPKIKYIFSHSSSTYAYICIKWFKIWQRRDENQIKCLHGFFDIVIPFERYVLHVSNKRHI